MSRLSKTRGTVIALLLVAIAATAWFLLHRSLEAIAGTSRHDVVFDPGYQHAHRLRIATARAAMDAVGMSNPENSAAYASDYRVQRMQIRADSIGLEHWAAHDVRRQALLREIRASLADLTSALDRTSGSAPSSGPPVAPSLLASLNRTQTALSNYAASLTEPARQTLGGYIFAGPVLLWWLLLLLLVELAVLAWVVFSSSAKSKLI